MLGDSVLQDIEYIDVDTLRDGDNGQIETPSKFRDSTNPLELDTIIDKVLECADRKTLFTCRRLNHRWNDQALRILQAKNVFLELHNDNIEKYTEYVRQTLQTKPHIGLSFLFAENQKYRHFDKLWMFRQINRLLLQFRQNSNSNAPIEGKVSFVKALICTSWYCREAKERITAIASLLEQVAPGLHRLQLVERGLQQRDSINLHNVKEFPELRFFSYGYFLSNTDFLQQIVNKAPKLAHLEVDAEVCNPLFFNQLNQNLAHVFNTITSFHHLTNLSTGLDSEQTYLALTRHHFPALQKLRLLNITNANERSSALLERFLAHNCPNLFSLELTFQGDWDAVKQPFNPNNPLVIEFPSQLPCLPKLTHFAYNMRSLPLCYNWDMIRMDNLRPKHFPGLQTVTLRFGTFLFFSRSFPGLNAYPAWFDTPAHINQAAFPSVGKLHLKIDMVHCFFSEREPKYVRVSIQNACKQLQMLFPNTLHMHLDIELRPYKKDFEGLCTVCRHLVETWRLESLEIKTNFIDFLSCVLSQDICMSVLQPSLKKLRIPRVGQRPKDFMTDLVNRSWCGNAVMYASELLIRDSGEPVFNLASILEWLRCLEKIVISEKLVYADNKLLEIRARFPNVDIALIEEKK